MSSGVSAEKKEGQARPAKKWIPYTALAIMFVTRVSN